MPNSISHIQFHIDPANLSFYRDLTGFLGWTPIYDGDGMLGVGGKDGSSLWFTGRLKEIGNDYDGSGMNHLGIAAESQAEVDAAVTWLAEHGIAQLFDTPRHRPDFSSSETDTYYQVMFETPDRILLEVVYTGPKES